MYTVTFDQKGPKLKSSLVYCSQLYLSLIWQLETEKPHYFVGCKQIPEKKFGHNSQLHVCPYHVNNLGPTIFYLKNANLTVHYITGTYFLVDGLHSLYRI